MNKYTVIDLFAGVGGLAKGFKNEGFEIVWANDIDENACKIYKSNICENIKHGDIRAIDTADIPSSDILIGSIPVQSFSVAAKKNAFYERKSLYYEIFRIINGKNFNIIVLETIKAIQKINEGKVFKELLSQLEQMGYYLKWGCMNSSEYGGIPFNYERLYIIGFKDKERFDKFNLPSPIPIEISVRDILSIEEQEDFYYLKKNDYNENIFFEINKKFTLYSLRWCNENVKTYKVTEDKECLGFFNNHSGMRTPLILDNKGIRGLTIYEKANFLGYNDFAFSEQIDKRKVEKYIGNCSNVVLTEKIAKEIKFALSNKNIYLVDDTHQYIQSPINKKTMDLECNNSQILDLKVELDTIEPGHKDATKYHDYMFEALKKIFDRYLCRAKKEREINEGRKRIDILFENDSKEGFFCDLNVRYKVECPKIIIECKNYNNDIANAELDQLVGRFKLGIGKFGILCCRHIDDKKKLLERLKDIYANGKFILVLEDEDIKELLKYRLKEEYDKLNSLLLDKWDELIL